MRPAETYFKYLYYLMHHGSLKKVRNNILNNIEKKLKKVYLKSLPINITIEPCNSCNLSCPGCVTGVNCAGSIPPGMLTLDQFKYIFAQIKDYVFNISLYKWGEPFLNKDIFLIIAHATSNRCGTTIHTNFNIFDESMAEQAVTRGLTHIYLSIDGATQETYEKYRRGGNLARVLKNIEILINTKKKLRSKFPILTWKYLYFPHNVHEIELAKLMAKRLGVDVFEAFPANLDNVSTFGTGRFYDLASGTVTTVTAHSCDSLWNSLIIYPDGSLLPCCQAFRTKDVFGNIYNQPLRTIWNNDDFITLRKTIKTRKIGQGVRYPCRECEVIKKLQEVFSK